MIGEALVDLVQAGDGPPEAHAGGSPFNVAVGLARLGVPTTLHATIGGDASGRLLREHLAASGVAITPQTLTAAPTSTALARLGADGAASYEFHVAWNPAPVETRGADLVHTGSIAAFLAPGADVVERALARADGLVSFDPNIRPALLPARDEVVARTERLVAAADVVKASDEDLAWLFPGEDPLHVLDRWSALGPRLLVVTRGEAGADALADGRLVHVDAPRTEVADTIGAGDAFMAALLARVLSHGFADPAGALGFAARAAALVVARVGADPARSEELAVC